MSKMRATSGIFKGRTALITGASSGIGKEFSLLFANAGCNLVLTGRDSARLDEVKERAVSEYGVKCDSLVADLSEDGGAKKLVDGINRLGLSIDILVNNAGVMTYGFFDKLPLDEEIGEIYVNVVSPVYLTHYFLNKMLKKNQENQGWILNVASNVALMPACPFKAVYGGTKSFLAKFSLALSHEYRDSRVQISCILLGYTKTGLWSHGNLVRKYQPKLDSMMSPRRVAEFGFNMLASGKDYAIVQRKIRVKAFIARFLPQSLMCKITRDKLYEKYLEE